MNKWEILHNYRRACLNDQAEFLMCPDCNTELYPTVDKDTEPALRCLDCRSIFRPGTNVFIEMEKQLALLSDLQS